MSLLWLVVFDCHARFSSSNWSMAREESRVKRASCEIVAGVTMGGYRESSPREDFLFLLG
jgi:hypothetical protein